MKRKFVDILSIVNGKNQKAVENPNGKYPIYGSGGLMGRADSYICESDTVIIGRKGNINNPIYVEEPFWNVDTAFGLVAKREILNPKYLFYFCIKYDFEKLNTTVTIPSLTKANLLKIEMCVPDKEVQDRVVKILEKIEEAIAYRRQQLMRLDNLIKSRFVEIFGDPITNSYGWNKMVLRDLAYVIQSGNTPKGGKQVYVNSGITFFRSQNVWRNRIELEDIAYIDEKTHKKMHRTSLRKNDILITKTGRFNTENSSLGRAAMYQGDDNQANINGHVYLVRLKEVINPNFVLFILTTDEYREYIRRVCVGGIDKRQINKEHLEEFPIILPPTELQNQFADFVQQVDKSKVVIQKSLDETQELFDCLMQKYFG